MSVQEIEVQIKDVIGAHDHTWVSIIQNPQRKPLWPPVQIRVNEYVAVVPRATKVLLARPLLENLRYAVEHGRTQLQFSEMGTLTAHEAHLVRLQTPEVVFPRTCAAPPMPPAQDAEQPKKGSK